MLKEFVDKLLATCEVKEHSVDGRTYSSRKLEPVMPPSSPTLKLLTLDSLVEFAQNYDKAKYMVHVENEKCVHLLAKGLDNWNSRECPAKATICDFSEEFDFDEFIDSEKFNIALQSQFVDVADRAKVLAVVGNMAVEATVKTEDDGITQKVSQQAGVVMKTSAQVPNPVELAPFRTFREVGQPISKFILRVSKTMANKPLVGLFEADGGTWRLAAIENIAKYLEGKMQGWTILS